MKKLLLLVTLLVYFNSSAQILKDCSKCASITYSDSDIINNKLYEIELLRNEIFARHNYIFKNQRLEAYYSEYDWYKPNYKTPINKINLNAIEQHNIDLFKTHEAKIITNRQLLINELEKFKLALKENDSAFIKSTFNGVIKNTDENFYSDLVNIMDNILNTVVLKNIYWHKGKAQYELLIDDGFSISSKGLYINGNTVTIMHTEPMTHSSLMDNNDAFQYPSAYYSESESTSGAKFEFKNGKLILIQLIFAG
ncbi:YARHG domain-containing protein [Olleya sp. Bg11-27]|uniref:YARHG domain-containing protein n=1 Tax=Olleya sp. Bg11-27 TaxID=2058135 RepID=UPI000C30C9D2|nr:YARHG domain-containing protein [Olleya sp. Bg11-27]AUC75530.1 hypothetical protein CW732_07520 [Olleya sp. Bg11-27]